MEVDLKYPEICPFYDKYFYNISNLSEEYVPMFFWRRMEKDDRWKLQEELLKYSRENLVRIVAYVAEPYVTIYEKDVVITPTTLIANIGGLMGLCMGFSLISLAEIIYYIFINPLFAWLEKIKHKGRI